MKWLSYLTPGAHWLLYDVGFSGGSSGHIIQRNITARNTTNDSSKNGRMMRLMMYVLGVRVTTVVYWLGVHLFDLQVSSVQFWFRTPPREQSRRAYLCDGCTWQTLPECEITAGHLHTTLLMLT